MLKLSEIYSDDAVKEFGGRLRIAVRMFDDYATLTELENVEKQEEFAEVIKRFLRRFEVNAKKYKLRHPSDAQLEHLMKLAQENTRLVRAALISYALVKSEKLEDEVSE
ncbi:MAG: hypothetical protein N2234_10970 [Planctomycetota bacterium]|nr:hypothetical protein [Planctomycetota bacterium]